MMMGLTRASLRGGKPNPGTSKDKRLKTNRAKGTQQLVPNPDAEMPSSMPSGAMAKMMGQKFSSG